MSATLVGRIVVTADFRRVGEILATGGFSVLLAFVPSLAAVAVDTAGWSLILSGLGPPASAPASTPAGGRIPCDRSLNPIHSRAM